MKDFIAIDFETSGLDSKRHAPVTIGAAIFKNGEYAEGREWLIAPPTDKNGRITREYDVCALEISGTSWTKIKKEGLPAHVVMRQLGQFLRENGHEPLNTVVAFNAPFDFAFFSELLFQAGGWNQVERRFEAFCSPLVGPWHCARLLAMWQIGEPNLPNWKLDTVAAHFGLARDTDLHSSLEDAVLAGRIYSLLTTAAASVKEGAA